MIVSEIDKKTKKWFEEIKEQIEFGNIDTRIDIPSELGKGYIESIKLFSGVYLFQADIVFNKDKKVNIVPSDLIPSDYYHTYFFDSKDRTSVVYGNRKFESTSNISNGVFFISPLCARELSFETTDRMAIIGMVFARNSIAKYLPGAQSKLLKNVFDNGSTFFFQHPLNQRLQDLITTLMVPQVSEMLLGLYKHGKAIELFTVFLEELQSKYKKSIYLNFKPTDVSNVLMVRQIVLSDLNGQPGVTRLANEAAMSQSKLHKVFKQVFGKSVYQYRLDARMDEARKLLLTHKYSVREIGHSLGYANISQFIKAFRKVYGTTPKGFVK
jgi:AraC-like DNA-binding protein